jgi:hypothetical protein
MYSSGWCEILIVLSEANMTDDKKIQDRAGFAALVKASLTVAKNKTAGIRKTDSRLFVANVVSPAAATLLAAVAAAVGGDALFARAAVQSESGGWRLACILVAIFSFIGTVSSMFKKQFEERLTQGNQCVGRLLNLDLTITTGNGSWEEAAKEYGEIVKTFPEFVG